MSCIRVRFITSGDFISRAICAVTNSLFSHVEFGTPQGTWIGAHDGDGVQERPENYCQPTREYVYEIPCCEQDEDYALAWMRARIGRQYNVLDIAGLLLHNRKLTTPHRVICSQFVSLGLLGVFSARCFLNLQPDYAYLITPETLHLSPIFVGRQVKKVEPAVKPKSSRNAILRYSACVLLWVIATVLCTAAAHCEACDQTSFQAARTEFAAVQARIGETKDAPVMEALVSRSGELDSYLTGCDRAAIAANTGAVGQLGCAQAHYAHHGAMALPDARVTPGAVDPNAVADLSGAAHLVGGIERNVCAKDFRTAPIRATIKDFPRLKRQACAEYGVARCDGSVEGDHLISIEVGGCPDCLTNLWPQPMDQARVKDHEVEDVLPKLVCAGKMTLREAQECIAGDWVACAARIKGLDR